jgi:alpha-D-ribose 1-methylphosphonate 5-triphosphate diphosphatase
LAEAFDEMGTLYGSLRDPDGETRERYSMIGARIALFPADRRAAAAAHAMMCPVILSAREVLAGGSGADLVAQGLVDALASDGAPADLARTALALAASATLPFARAWGLISSRPAELLRLADRGTLNPGARADMTILDAATHAPSGTIVRGRLVYATPALADRFAGTAGGMAHAAE